MKILARTSRALLGIAVAVVLAVAATLLFFAVPANDDFVRATRPRELGWWGYVFGFTYMKWQGRWTSCGLESALLPRLDITQYYWVLIGGIVLVEFIAASTAIRFFVRDRSKRSVAATAAVLLALLWSGMPSPAEAVYWFTGAVENALVLALATLLLVWLCDTGVSPTTNDFPQKRTTRTAWVAFPLTLFAFVIAGFHELYGTMLCMALAAGTLLAFWCKTPNRKLWLAVTVAATAGLIVVVAAPGNSARFVTDGGPHSRQLRYGLTMALSQFFFYPKWWLLNPQLIAATVWVACRGLHTPRITTAVQKHLLWIGPLTWFAMLAFGFYCPSWALGAKMPPRTLSGNYVVFVVGLLVNIYLWGRWFGSAQTRPTIIAARLAEIALALSMLLVGPRFTGWQTTGHLRDAVIDFHYNLVPWHDAVEDRFAILRQVHGGNARVIPLPSGTRLLPAGETVTPGPLIFTTSLMSYFQLHSFHVVPPPEKDPIPRR